MLHNLYIFCINIKPRCVDDLWNLRKTSLHTNIPFMVFPLTLFTAFVYQNIASCGISGLINFTNMLHKVTYLCVNYRITIDEISGLKKLNNIDLRSGKFIL